MIRPGLTAWVAGNATSEALAVAIDEALVKLDESTDLRASCRDVAEREYDVALQARRYLALFESLRDGRRPPSPGGAAA